MTQHAAPVEWVGNASDNGLASMIGTLISQNLEDHQELRSDLARMHGRVALIAEDVEVSLTLQFMQGRLLIHDGIVGLPDITLRAGSDEILSLSLVESTTLGLPDLRGEHLQKVAKGLWQGRLRLYGFAANLPLLLRLNRLMAVSSPG